MTSFERASEPVPAFAPLFAVGDADDLSSHRHRQLLGYTGFALPWVVIVIAGWRPTAGQPADGLLDSLSAYYYSGAVAAFVGFFVAMAAFLITYHGFSDDRRRLNLDRVAAIIASISAIGVAFYPSRAPSDALVPLWWTPWTGRIHFVAAGVMFCAFIFFCLVLFPKSDVRPGQPLPKGKRFRNWVYRVCGTAMVVCFVWTAIAVTNGGPIFWAETAAIEFFAISWLVKGRADLTLRSVAQRARHFGANPRQLVRLLQDAQRR